MPQNGIEKLSDLSIKNAPPKPKRYKLCDGEGLQLEVLPIRVENTGDSDFDTPARIGGLFGLA
jgi:hypothetical protein